MGKDWKTIATNRLKQTKDKAAEVKGTVRKAYESSDAKALLDKTSTGVQDFLEKKGVNSAARKVTSTVDHHLSTLSGQKLLELVEERLELQARYNDILATRLDEALTRIQVLEGEIKKLQRPEKRK